MNAYQKLQAQLLQTTAHTWLVTGVAGFIGSKLPETLRKLNQISQRIGTGLALAMPWYISQ